MENKMKKLMLIAALGAAAIFTACGDDSSSGPSEGCSVSTSDNSVTVTMSMCGQSMSTTYTVTENGYKITTDGAPDQEIATPMTVDQLKEMGDSSCKAFNEAETVTE